MRNKRFKNRIIEKLEPSFDISMLVGAIISGLISFIIIYRGLANLFTFSLDILMTLVLGIMFLFRDKLDITFKVLIVVGIIIFSSINSVIRSGLLGTGYITYILALFLTMFFLDDLRKKIIFGFTIVFFSIYLSLIYFKVINYEVNLNYNEFSLYLIIFLAFITTVKIIDLIMKNIEKYLLETINDLENNILELEKSKIRLEKQNLEITVYKDKILEKLYFDEKVGLRNLKSFEEYNFKGTETIYFLELRSIQILKSLIGINLYNDLIKKISKIFKKNFKDVFIINNSEWAIIEDECRKDFYMVVENLIRKDKYTKMFFNQIFNNIFYIGCFKFEDNEDVFNLYQIGSITITKAKENENEKMICYTNKLYKELEEELLLKDEISRAIKDEEFVLFYQEKFNVEVSKVVGIEILARWNKNGKILSPYNFIETVENSFLNIPFGEYIIDKTFSNVAKILNGYSNSMSISINISPVHLMSKNFIDFIKNKIKEYKIDTSYIVFEITESSFIQNEILALEQIKKIKELGIRISLDDFGTGYSSLHYLLNLTFDILKIDKSFIDNIENDDKLWKLVFSIITIAKTNNLKIIAEGVENIEQVNILSSLGCKVIQGYYYSKPQSIESLFSL